MEDIPSVSSIWKTRPIGPFPICWTWVVLQLVTSRFEGFPFSRHAPKWMCNFFVFFFSRLLFRGPRRSLFSSHNKWNEFFIRSFPHFSSFFFSNPLYHSRINIFPLISALRAHRMSEFTNRIYHDFSSHSFLIYPKSDSDVNTPTTPRLFRVRATPNGQKSLPFFAYYYPKHV